MKRITFLVAGIIIAATASAQTHTLKLAYINSGVIISAMPEKIKADTEIARYQRTFQEELDIMGKDYQQKVQEFNDQSGTWSDAVKEVKTKEIQDLQSRIESTQQGAQEKVQQKKSDLWQPIVDKATKALNEVAKENDYDFVFDQAGGGTLVFAKDMYDVTGLVKKKLGLK